MKNQLIHKYILNNEAKKIHELASNMSQVQLSQMLSKTYREGRTQAFDIFLKYTESINKELIDILIEKAEKKYFDKSLESVLLKKEIDTQLIEYAIDKSINLDLSFKDFLNTWYKIKLNEHLKTNNKKIKNLKI